VSGQYFQTHSGTVTLTGNGTRLGTATMANNGSFSTTVTIPAGTPAGAYTISATIGSESATTSITVVAKGAQGTLVVSWQGHAYTQISTDDPFTLTGNNLTPGAVTIYVDGTSGPQVGTATVGANGTFSNNFSVSYNQLGQQLGQRKLVAVQNGSVVAELGVTFVLPEVIH
jgi:hypothetical protein